MQTNKLSWRPVEAGKVLAAEFGNFLAKLQYFLHQRADNVLEKRHLVLRIVNSVDKFESSGQRVNLIGSVVVTHVSDRKSVV